MKLIKLTKGKFVKVDDEDFNKLNQFRWYFNVNGYAARRDSKQNRYRHIYMHRVITGCPQGVEVDHKNNDRLDNRKCNLRVCTRQENAFNRLKQSNNTSGYRGVVYCRDKFIKKWKYQIKKGQEKHCGYYLTAFEASIAYDKKAKELFGEFAALNGQS